MKRRFALCILILASVVLAAVLWRRPVHHGDALEPQAEPTLPARPSNKLPGNPGAESSLTQRLRGRSSPRLSSAPVPMPTDEERRRVEEAQRFADAANVPIDFYAQVVDQDTNALSGVTVRVSVRHLSAAVPGLPPPDLSEYDFAKQTGPDGRFEVADKTGDGLDVKSMEKPGYELAPNTYRSYGAGSGTYANPVVFVMWNTNIHERLITGHKSFDIVPDGRPYVIDFAKGTITGSGAGDLKVWIKYSSQLVRGETYDWSCQIDVMNGGLRAQPDLTDSMFVAPTEGYIPSFQLQQQIKGGQRGSIGGQRHFYVSLNNGQEYGRMEIGLYAPFNNETPGLVSVSYAINPSGSRILR